jgi:hypothetical protein
MAAARTSKIGVINCGKLRLFYDGKTLKLLKFCCKGLVRNIEHNMKTEIFWTVEESG